MTRNGFEPTVDSAYGTDHDAVDAFLTVQKAHHRPWWYPAWLARLLGHHASVRRIRYDDASWDEMAAKYDQRPKMPDTGGGLPGEIDQL